MSNSLPVLKRSVSTRLVGRVNVDVSWDPEGVTDQFMENADTYHARYYDNKSWTNLLSRALEKSCIDCSLPLRILDIGSGSGNTVFAALELMPNSVVFASDISPQLLQILIGIQDQVPHLVGRIEAYCFDLHKDFFAEGTFDLVIGGAILHHMLDPEAALKNVAKWIRPGGKILLMEPLEIGGHLMCAIYLTLLAELNLEVDADPKLISFFKAICHDYEARFGVPRLKPWTHVLDDKWLFHPSYLCEMASKIGLELELVTPAVENTDSVFSNSVLTTLRLAGLGDVALPNRLLKVLKTFDDGISPNLKSRLTPEGIIVLVKR